MKRLEILGTLACAWTIALFASSAEAQSCEATSECPKNFLCSVVGSMGCGSVGVATPAGTGAATSGAATAGSGNVGFAPANGAASSGGGSSGVSCGTSIPIKQCVALTCTSDLDCAVGWACKTDSSSTCPTRSGGAAAGGSAATIGTVATAGNGATFAANNEPAVDVAMPAAGSSSTACITTSKSTCQPKAQGPCTTADDCGPGYECVDQESCGCSSSGWGGAANGGATAVSGSAVASDVGPTGQTGVGGASSIGVLAPPTTIVSSGGGTTSTGPECHCTSTGVKGCQALTIACIADADCPETWTCAGNVDSIGVLNGTCEPPYTYYGGGSWNSGNGIPTAGGAGSVDISQGVGGALGSTKGTALPAANGTTNEGHNGNAAAPNDSSGGCQMGRGSVSSFAAILLGAVAALGFQRRRRFL